MSEEKKAEATPPPKRKMVRSPNSPSLSLSDALAKAKVIYEVEKKIPTTPEVMLAHIGYKSPILALLGVHLQRSGSTDS